MAKAKTIAIPSLATFSSTFDIAENVAPDIVGIKKGQRVKILMSYEVIEKTKNFTILRIGTISLQPSRRKL